MKPSIIEVSMGHSLGGVSDSYFRPREEEVFEEYIKAVDSLTISPENKRNAGSKEEVARLADREELYSMVVDIIQEYVERNGRTS
jgi:hypothetical protein